MGARNSGVNWPLLRGLAALASCGLLSAAWAQDEISGDGEDPLAMEEIVVTATKRSTNLMETPLAVSAFTQDDLDREGVADVTDLSALVPGLEVGLSPSDSGVQVTVRGITSNNFTELGDPSVGIHVDGMYSPRPQSGLAMMHDVDRVEILRGPQGTLFGRNSTSGAINIISARPKFDSMSGYVSVGYGRFSALNMHGVLNLPVSDSFALRTAVMVDRADSYIYQEPDYFDLAWDTDNDGSLDGPHDVRPDGIPNVDQRRNEDVGDSDAYFNADRWAGRISALFTPGDAITWLLSYEHYNDRGAGTLSLKDCEKAEGTFFACDHDQWYATVNVPGKLDMSIRTLRSELVWDVAETMVFELRLAHSSQERFQQYDGDGGVYPHPDHPAYGINRNCCGQWSSLLIRDPEAIIAAGFQPYAIQPWNDLQLTTNYSDYDSRVAEVQLKSLSDAPLQWIGGLFWMREDNAIRFDVENPFCCEFVRPLALSFVQPDRQVHAEAAFLQLDYSMNEQLNFTFGYRHTRDEKIDNGGKNHETIGYWVNPTLYGPPNDFWYESYTFIGDPYGWGITNHTDYYQSDDLTDQHGTLSADFLSRVPGTDNSYQADWSKSTWRVGADYLVNEDLFLYGYVATGYRAGGFGDNVDVTGCGDFENFDFDPEYNTTWEFGWKSTHLEGRLNLLGAVFYSDYSDMQRTLWAVIGNRYDCATGEELEQTIGTLLTTNLAGADIKGIEFEWDWWAWEGGRFFGWVNYLDAKISEMEGAEDGWYCFERAWMGLTPCPPPNPAQGGRRTADFTGNRLPWSPRWSTSMFVEHNWYRGDLRLSPYFSAHWSSEMFFNDNNFDEGPYHTGQPATATFSLAFRVINEKAAWALELYSYNLTDEYVRAWMDGGPGFLRASFFPPRTYGVKFRKDF